MNFVRRNQILSSIAPLAIAIVIAMSVTVLCGWIYNVTILKTLLPGRPDMKANAAVCFLLTSLAVVLVRDAALAKFDRSSWRKTAATLLAGFVILFSTLVLLEYIFGVSFGIDELLFLDPNGTHGHSPPGRFSPVTATNFVLLTIGLLLDLLPERPLYRLSQGLFMFSFLISLQSFLGNALGMNDVFGLGLFIPMALPTAAGFTLLSIAFLLSRTTVGLMERFSSGNPSSVMARRMLMAVVLVPPLIRAISILGAKHGLYSIDFSIFIQVIGGIVFMSGIVIQTAGALLKVEHERELSRVSEHLALKEAESERDKLHQVFQHAPSRVDMFRGSDHVFGLAHPLTVELAGGRCAPGMKLREAFPEFAKIGLLKEYDRVFQTGEPYSAKEVALNIGRVESYCNISIQAWRGATGEIEGVISFSVDVSDQVEARKIAEASREEVKRHAEQLRLVTDSLPSLISYIGRDQRYQVVNEAYEKWFGKPKSYYIGKGIAEALSARASTGAIPYVRQVLNGEQVTFSNVHVLSDGREINVLTTFIPDKDASGFVRGFIVVSHDVTQEIRTKEELKSAKDKAEEASLAKSQFLANMSHEIRTPLGVILGFSDLAIESLNNPEEAKGFLTSIRRNAEELAKLLGEILDLSKVEAKKLEVERIPFELFPVVDEVKALLAAKAREKNIELEFVYAPNVPKIIESDPTRLRQILINLVGNAIKFTKNGAVRLLVAGEKVADQKRVKLRFEVYDSGIGISDDQKQRLFKPFSQADSSMTRKFGGTGLGLTLSKQLAIALGGDLELRSSAIGHGSLFVATIEAGVEAETIKRVAQTVAQPSASNATRLEGMNLLLVEDSEDNRVLVSRYIRSTGANVEMATNGQEGVAKALSDAYDVILMDIQMPVMDGFTATQVLRERGFTKPIIALTAHAVQEEREKALRCGFDTYLTKPINKSVLFDALRAVRMSADLPKEFAT